MIAEMNQLNKTGMPHPVEFEALKRVFEMHSRMTAEHANNRQNANRKASEIELEFASSLSLEMRAISATELDYLACAIRLELNIETDREAFRAQSDELFAAMDSATKETQKLVEKMNGQLPPNADNDNIAG